MDLDNSLLEEVGLSQEVLEAEVRLEIALGLYRRDLISVGKGAEMAGVSYEEMKRVVLERDLGTGLPMMMP